MKISNVAHLAPMFRMLTLSQRSKDRDSYKLGKGGARNASKISFGRRLSVDGYYNAPLTHVLSFCSEKKKKDVSRMRIQMSEFYYK